MRQTIKIALLTGVALTAAACNRQAPANNGTANEVGQNENQVAPGPDASAVESQNNAPEPLPPPPAANGSDYAVSSDAPGGDTGGNNVETNTPGI